MASHVKPHSPSFPTPQQKIKHLPITLPLQLKTRNHRRNGGGIAVIRASNGDSYLDMWKKAVDREKEEVEFLKIVGNLESVDDETSGGGDGDREVLERKSDEFEKILEVPKEERDRVQRMQVVDRAAAAIAAAKAILKEKESGLGGRGLSKESDEAMDDLQEGGTESGSLFVSQSEAPSEATPGPDFWAWTPPLKNVTSSNDFSKTQTVKISSPFPVIPNPVMEKERNVTFLSIPFETKLTERNLNPPLPPLQSFVEVDKVQKGTSPLQDELEFGVQFSAHAVEAAHALDKVSESSHSGEYPDGSRWWKETGIEKRPDGVVCKWTMIRGVSADEVVEWEEKFWEAADGFDYKELGSEKSGRDANGNVWHEYWKESMWQDCGLLHLQKTADKWGKNGKGDEWREKWWEQYNASGKAEKWAHKWSSIDPNTQLEAGHAHIWHERWGEKYDGRGASIKYTDKWAERSEGDGWSKWGDKWDENFDINGNGVKQGETWWEGKCGDRWNRTWGEGHNGSGWVHKYGKSSSGEHWDTHEEQETWYERYPHFGFMHCFDNSGQLRDVQKPSAEAE